MSEKNLTIYYAKNYSHSWYDSENNIMVVKVLNLNLGIHRQNAFVKNVEVMRKHKPKAIILDFGEAKGSHMPSDLDWIINVAFPEYKTLGIHLVLCIFPTNHIAKLGAKTWIDIAEGFGFSLINVNSLDEAYNIAIKHG
jgi:hypothetical protein